MPPDFLNLTPAEVRKDKYLQRVYGMSLWHWWKIYDVQDGKCGCCKKDLNEHANVDHEHGALGFVRGLTCPYCNRYRVGRHKWPEIEQVRNYLKNPPAWQVGDFHVPARRPRKRKR